ncbi:Fe-S protein assembly co-chaperone HscB [Neisseria sp. oral taxon 014 str. F0314]|jgi:Fe-S protein assembly co-chaperone hscB|uniref:Fe-S protein assembly co-chaperone HscB n=1 Tax=Neisseria sp. oral taxon 014 TaxID=641148 RepID=UPI0001D8C7DC|nr:Fe-S protein assembly co-chaperone HscB [Neisseria sp. oral taxon 014]EFI23910.1 Fe-S protein assembly co-chaperone HscB [Neisseria sp. oral taxon 014 str. F0314]
MSQYFTLFQLEPQFDIDTDSLEQNYRTLAARFHPDRFASASAFEQKQAVMMSSTINEAYRTLKNPTDRAAYLLRQQGIDADAPEHTSFAPEFLMQQMEWRETLAEARGGQDQTALPALDKEISGAQQELWQDLREAFRRQQYEDAAQLVRQGRFLDKLKKEISNLLQ